VNGARCVSLERPGRTEAFEDARLVVRGTVSPHPGSHASAFPTPVAQPLYVRFHSFFHPIAPSAVLWPGSTIPELREPQALGQSGFRSVKSQFIISIDGQIANNGFFVLFSKTMGNIIEIFFFFSWRNNPTRVMFDVIFRIVIGSVKTFTNVSSVWAYINSLYFTFMVVETNRFSKAKISIIYRVSDFDS